MNSIGRLLELEDAKDEVVVSSVQVKRKTERMLDLAAEKVPSSLWWMDLPKTAK